MGRRKKTTEEFIAEAIGIHGNKYDYSEVLYVTNRQKVTIRCKLHGSFEQTPNKHVNLKRGCRQCAIERQRISFSEFANAARLTHNNEYTYYEQEFTDSITKMKIKHDVCGSTFLMSPNAHVSNRHGCPECADQRYSLNEFINKVISQNPIIYSITCSNYINIESKCNVTCIKGHEWTTKATNLLRGCSCPICTKSGFKTNKNATFYILSINGEHSFTGFGITNIWRKRRTQHKKNLKSNNCSIQYEILIESDGKTIQALEQHVKQTLHCNNSNIAGFKTESVLISPEELKIFCENYLQKECASYKIVVNR